MKNLRTNDEPDRLTNGIRSEIVKPNRFPLWPGFLLITVALIWVGLSPITSGADRSQEGGYLNPNLFSRDYRQVILADEPVMYWRLGERSGPLAYDESTSYWDATYVGNPTLGMRGAIVGDPNTAVGFNGINQFAQWSPTRTISGTFTVEAWVKEKKLYREQTFFNTSTLLGNVGIANFGFDFGFDLLTLDYVGGSGIRFDIGDGTRWLSSGRIPLDVKAGVWYHVATVVTSTAATIYLDGVEIGSVSYTGTPLLCDFTHKVEIGQNTGSPTVSNQVQSVIDEVAIYNYALTDEQISTHYLTGNPPGE